jgi:hypothetical protein
MSIGVNQFEVPHAIVRPTRDMVIIRIPAAPRTVGDKVKFIVPDASRELAQHNIAYGVIHALGPLAFTYKDGNGLAKQDAKVGDWALIRPFAGTLMAGGKLVSTFGWRYVSSFQDIIGILPAADMPDVSLFEWDTEEGEDATLSKPAAKAAADFNFNAKKAV